jgi:hypothetical protein
MTARGTDARTAGASSSASITAGLEISVEQSSRGAPKIKSNLKAESKNKFVSQRFNTELGAEKGDKKERLPDSVLQISKTAA